jgi:SAM-dependent methyltransferase
MIRKACRFCDALLEQTFVDLGVTPLANSYLEPEELEKEEPRYPLHAVVCERCRLVQLDAVVDPEEIFSDYAYFSSYSETWLAHARRFAEDARKRLHLDGDSLVLEIASNDGYLLRHFRDLGIRVLGIEPAENVAAAAAEYGVPTEVCFFGSKTAERLLEEHPPADLVVANNVLAHVPELNDFVAGIAAVLAPDGVVTIEVPHLLRLIEGVEFDTIYHEHYSYFSLYAIEQILSAKGLAAFDAEQLSTHGGSLRVWAAHDHQAPTATARLDDLRATEAAAGINGHSLYENFAPRVKRCRELLLQFVRNAQAKGDAIVGYGAAAKGNTLLNYCGITAADIAYVMDRSPHKQGRYLPGSRIPIAAPTRVTETAPDYVLILPWNITDEIVSQMKGIQDWGGRFVVAIPETRVIQ